MPEEDEVRSVELSEAKAGVVLRAGHSIVLVVNGAHGNPRFRRLAGRDAAAADGASEEGAAAGGPSGEDGPSFLIEIQLKAAGGTPLAGERVRLHDPDTGEPVGAAVVTDENGVLRARVPAEKDYHVMVETDSGAEEELPAFEVDPEGEEKSAPEHWMLSVELVDGGRAPLKGEKVEATAADGTKLTLVTDDEGCIHELADLGVYRLAVRGKTFAAHTILHEDRQGTAVGYRFTVA